jgi:hypothetical protein
MSLSRRDTLWAGNMQALYVRQVYTFPKSIVAILEFLRTQKWRLVMAMAVCSFNLFRDQLNFEQQFMVHTQIVTTALISDTCFVLLEVQLESSQIDFFALVIIFYAVMHLINPILMDMGNENLYIVHVSLCTLAHVFHYTHIYLFCKARSVISTKNSSLLLLEILEALVNASLFHKQFFRPLSAATLSFLVYHTAFHYVKKSKTWEQGAPELVRNSSKGQELSSLKVVPFDMEANPPSVVKLFCPVSDEPTTGAGASRTRAPQASRTVTSSL